MQPDDARIILEYATDIPRKLRAMAVEIKILGSELSCLRGIEYGGAPHGSGHSDPTAEIAERADEMGYISRLKKLEEQSEVCRDDLNAVSAQIWTLNTVYVRIITEIWIKGNSVEKTAEKIGYSTSHTKRLKAESLARLAEALEGLPGVDGLKTRAYNARK